MCGRNLTIVTEFLLLGFGNLHSFKILFFLLYLLVYVVSLAGNFLVICLVERNQSLHSPMYFFITQLSLSEILFTTNIMPNMIRLILEGEYNVSVAWCLIQFYLLAVPTVAQCLVLAAMSFDRYVAICNPLNYATIMTFKLQLRVVIISWFLGFSLNYIVFYFLAKLEFCGSNVIDHFYCDIAPLAEISDTTAVELVTSVLSTPIVIFPFAFIIVTYIVILLAILRIPSITGQKKAFSTCSSHITVVCMYYGTLTINYTFPPKEHSMNFKKSLSLLYVVVTPLFNPIVYSLRNQDIRGAIRKSLNNCKKWIGF